MKEGRPPLYNESIVHKLVAAVERGMSITIACQYAQISRRVFYKWMEENEEFMHRIERAKVFVTLTAAEVVTSAILDKKDVAASKWWLERKEFQEFSTGKKVQGV